MEEILKAEIHDAKIKLVNAINSNDTEFIAKYESVISNLEKCLELLQG